MSDWLRKLMETDPEYEKRKKNRQVMSEEMQDLFTKMDEETTYIEPDNED
nr:MAG TPA: hypothetical protein [Caudoviricetes sp.]